MKFRSVRGMCDVLPSESEDWAKLESSLVNIVSQYGYQEIRFPLVEMAELFVRSIGSGTDIVDKEMYLFSDRNGDNLALRPEGTAGCIRAGIEHGLLYHQTQRWFYYGPMFRHERPQRGRYRQFHQFGVEAFGFGGVEIDIEIMLLAARFWQELGIKHKLALRLNSLGDVATRLRYRQRLVDYLQAHYELLDEDSQRRLLTNPIRVLDSKNPALKKLIDNAPTILTELDSDSRRHLDKLTASLELLDIQYQVDYTLVRGLDYYNSIVFEWVVKDQAELAQNAVCAGGHYDNLVAELGGEQTPAIGFAVGLERLLTLIDRSLSSFPVNVLYLIVLGEAAMIEGLRVAENLREIGQTVLMGCSEDNLKTQLKRADKSSARLALILGEEELSEKKIRIKYLREEREQLLVNIDRLGEFVRDI